MDQRVQRQGIKLGEKPKEQSMDDLTMKKRHRREGAGLEQELEGVGVVRNGIGDHLAVDEDGEVGKMEAGVSTDESVVVEGGGVRDA